jgi:acyl carrier protein
MADAVQVETTIRGFLKRANKGHVEFDRATPLYAGGIGLDSLATAELSAVLEDDLGTDPFSQGDMPQTVGDILAFYERGGAAVPADAYPT